MRKIAVAAYIGVVGVGFAAVGAEDAVAKSTAFRGGRDVPPISELRRRVAGKRWEREPAAAVVERAVGREQARLRRIFDLFVAAGDKYGVDPRLLYSVCKQESSFGRNRLSPVGARGLMQLMPETARQLGVDPWDDAQAVDGAARLFRDLLRSFRGDVAKAVAAYNAGETAVRGWGEGFSFRNRKGRLMNARRIKTADGLPPYKETQHYVRVISATWRETDWARVFGAEVASRLGGSRLSPRGVLVRSEVARVERERRQLATESVADEKVAAPNAKGASRFYAGLDGGDGDAAMPAVVVADGEALKVVSKAGAESVDSEATHVDVFSGARYVRAEPAAAHGSGQKPAVSRTSVYVGTEE